MKITKVNADAVYAVGYSYGINANGIQYANVLVAGVVTPLKRSDYSIYLDPQDEKQLAKYGLTPSDLNFDQLSTGERKSLPLKNTVLLEGAAMYSVSHAPWGKDSGKTNTSGRHIYRWYDVTYVVVLAGQDPTTTCRQAVQRAYKRADVFARGKQFYDDYREFL